MVFELRYLPGDSVHVEAAIATLMKYAGSTNGLQKSSALTAIWQIAPERDCPSEKARMLKKFLESGERWQRTSALEFVCRQGIYYPEAARTVAAAIAALGKATTA